MFASILIWALGYFPIDKKIQQEYEIQKAEVEAAYDRNVLVEVGDAERLEKEKTAKLESLHRQEIRERQENSYISRMGRAMEPIWSPLGFDWKAGVSLLTGVAAKEVVVSTMAVLYQSDDNTSASSLEVKLKEEGFTTMEAIIFMVFVLLYLPCFASLIAIDKEIGYKWAIFVMGYTIVLAWVVCFVLKQMLDLFM